MGGLTIPLKNLNNLESLTALLNELSKINAEIFIDSHKQILSLKSKKTSLSMDFKNSKIDINATELNITCHKLANIKNIKGTTKLDSKSLILKSNSTTSVEGSSLNLKAKGRVAVKGAVIDLN